MPAAPRSILKNPLEAGPSKGQSRGGGKPGAGPKLTASAKFPSKHSSSTPKPTPTHKSKPKATFSLPKRDEDDSDGDIDMDSGDDDEELETEDEIELAKSGGEPKKAQKRKRVTTASDFGSTLTTLLTEPSSKPSKRAKKPTAAPAGPASASATGGPNPILSLSAKPLPPSQAAVSLERRAARQLKAEREERLDRARVRNVLEGWAPAPGAGDVGSQEFERGLRKVAQRGVIKLFNAILVASRNAEEAAAKLPLSAQAGLKPEAPKSKREKDNIMGRGARDDVLTKESFLDLVRKGGR